MKVVFLEDVTGVAQGGEVKDVKNGFARNYLIPQKLAVPVTPDSMQRVQRLTRQAEGQRIKTLNDMKALGEKLDGMVVNVEMRAGASGRLYGSVTNAIVAEELSKMIGREIDRRSLQLPESIRQIGVHDVRLRLHAEVDANIQVLVYPAGTDPADVLASVEQGEGAEDAEVGLEEAREPEEGTEEPVEAEAEDEQAAEVGESDEEQVEAVAEETPESE